MEMMTSNELKNSLVELLCDFDLFARKNNLRYSLAYGTLLGSIRHQGFIPWDDDIDLWMPRPDFERMLSIPYVGEVDVCLKSHLNGRFLFPYAKLTRADVEIDDPFWNSCGKQNLFIDIFPLDGLPDDPSSVEHLYREALKIKNDIAKSDVGIGFEKSAFRKIAKRAYIALRGGRRWRTRSYEKMQSLWCAYPYEDSTTVGMYAFPTPGLIEIMEKSDFETAISKGKFEGRDFPIPGNWDPILECLYGDYMTPPAPSQRSGHGLKAYKVALSQVEKQR